MRLDFNVLWIDNQPDNVRSYQERLSIKLESEGFKLQISDALSYEAAQQLLVGDVFRDGIDLVIVDYDLGATYMKGDEAVREIRNFAQYKDIVLYSSIDTVDLKGKVLSLGVEGIFCAHRDDLSDTLIGLFEALVKKVLDIDHCRGIVMGATSDIDYVVNECLTILGKSLEPEHQTQASDYVLKKLDERLERFGKVRARLAAGLSITDMIKDHEAVPAADRLKLLKTVVELRFPDSQDGIKKSIGQYIANVPHRRNKLGHVRLVAKDALRLLQGEADTVSAEELRDLRRLLIGYRDEFDKLLTIVSLLGTDEPTKESDSNIDAA